MVVCLSVIPIVLLSIFSCPAECEILDAVGYNPQPLKKLDQGWLEVLPTMRYVQRFCSSVTIMG